MSLPTCPSCIYAQGICEKTGVKIRHSTGCTYHKPKPTTNGDRIRSMSDEELAEYFPTHASLCPDLEENKQVCKGANFMANDEMCRQCWLGWLKQKGE